jgi:hypothetical protein
MANQCPTCGYLLDSLDEACPRCTAFRAKGVDPRRARTEPNSAHLSRRPTAPATIATDAQQRDEAAMEVMQLGHQIATCCYIVGFLMIAFGIVDVVVQIHSEEASPVGVPAIILGIIVIGTGRIWRILCRWGAEVLRALGRLEQS